MGHSGTQNRTAFCDFCTDLVLPPSGQHEVEVTLEDILSGTRKSVSYVRQIAKENGEIEHLPATLSIDIPPGTMEGSQFQAAAMVQLPRGNIRS